MGWKTRWNKPIASVLATAVLSLQVFGGIGLGAAWGTDKAEAASAATAKLRLMSTTDVHTNVYGWDYFKNAASTTVGLDRTATLVTYARSEYPDNNLLLDNGDLIQGTPLGTYIANESNLVESETKLHPMIAAMNIMEYDVATFGNHEFNYGLEFLNRTIKGSANNPLSGADFPYVNANIYIDDKDGNPDNDVNAFEPYVILDKK